MIEPSSIYEEAKRTGRIWLGGEHEFRFGLTCDEAYNRLYGICCACGGVVAKRGGSMLTLSHPEHPGYYLLDWYDSDRPGPARIDLYNPKSTRAEDFGLKTTRPAR
jgi:hypothetical protein